MSSHFTLGLRTLRVAGLTVALFAAMCTPLLAQAPPSADTFVSSAFSKTNFGSVGTMNVGGGSTSYMQFNLSGIPSGASVTKATLRLYVDLVISNGTFDVYQVNKSWSESALTYNNQPLPLGSSATGGHPISITSSSFNQFLLIDITALAQSWVSGSTPNYGVALALPSGSAANFYLDSKESLLTANGPELEIALAGAAGPQGPQGPQGLQGTQGTAGAVGPTGPTGATGSPGATGAAGPKGDTGATGPQGSSGPSGPQGAAGAQGPQGVIGPVGITGAQGPQGNPGSAGTPGAAGQGFNFRGAFAGSASYAAYDVVSYNGSSYDATAATNPGDPTPDVNPNWSLMAQQGAAGANGAAGASGPIGLTGATGAAGAQGPQGLTGATGPAGTQGPQGIPGLNGSTGAQGPPGVNGALGSQGPAGPTGPPGPAGNGGPGLAEIRAALLQWYPATYGVGNHPVAVAFDGTNIWVPNAYDSSVTKLLASTGAVVGTYAVGNWPNAVAFDGTNIWVTNQNDNTVTKIGATR